MTVMTVIAVPAVEANSVCPETALVTASSYYDEAFPQNAYDCNLPTNWNSGTYTGSITAQFTAPINFDGVVLTANALPTTDEDYTIYGSNDGSTWTPIAQATRQVQDPSTGFNTLEPITFPQVTYQYLQIDIDGGASWVSLNEVQLCIGGCIDYGLDVDIDIKPNSFPNSINLKSKGNVPVAILSSPSFDAATVDRGAVEFAGAPALSIGGSPEDVNGDGLMDLILHFSTQSLNLKSGDTEACLTGKTLSEQEFKGCDSVLLVN